MSATGFQATSAEHALVNQIFAQHDTQKIGILTGDVAVRVFGGAKLPPTTLGEIWSIADEENNGWLSKKGVAVALRLIGWAQKGETVTKSLVNRPGSLPTIEGVNNIASHSTGMSAPRSPPPTAPLPPLTAQDKAKFQNLFHKAGPVNGLLSGEKARDIFVKSKLSNDTLLQIWNLADAKDRGTLDAADFAIGMYLIQGIMTDKISAIPNSLPTSLYYQAGGSPPNAGQSSLLAQMTGTSTSYSPIDRSFPTSRPVQPQYTGQNALMPEITGNRVSAFPQAAPHLPPRSSASALGSGAFSPQPTGSNLQWDVTQTEKANFDGFFDRLDQQHQGYIEGDIAVPFMLESKLSGEILAQVWDLADINGDGRLTRDCFAVAMHLIQKKLAGVEVPNTLPQSLIPPAMRSGAIGNHAFSAPLPPQPEPVRDLFSFDDEPTPPVPATSAFSVPLQPQQTGSRSTPRSPPPVPPTRGPLSGATSPLPQDPFGSSFSGGQNFLDNDDLPSSSPPLQDQSAEIGNLQNQLSSTQRSLSTTKADREAAEQTAAQQESQLSSLQTQLSSAKAAYETESKLLSALRERLAGQTTDIQRAREELIRAESDLSAVRMEKSEVEQTLLRDKEDARDLHKKMVETGQLAEAAKIEIEKVKRDAKQQKGMLAVAKKQLLTKETEKARAEKELAEAHEDLRSATQEKDAVDTQLTHLDSNPVSEPQGPVVAPSRERTFSDDSFSFAAAQPLPVSPTPGTPSVASAKSNNPFDRLTGSATPRSQSPFLPFANASVPTPPVSLVGSASASDPPVAESEDVSIEDPFGFSKGSESTVHQDDESGNKVSETLATTVSTPKASPAVMIPEGEPPSAIDVGSPATSFGTDTFATPPSSARRASHFSTQSPAQEDFPPIEAIHPTTSLPGAFPEESAPQTDLNSALKEIEHDGSDTDSDEDEVPLATLAREKADKKENGHTGEQPGFDDIFATSLPTALEPTPKDETFGAANGPTGAANGASSNPGIQPAGVDAFDEAMGNLAKPASAIKPDFGFDSSFDDTFDFGSSPNPTAEPAFPSAPSVTGGQEASDTKGNGFDDLFGTSPTPATQVVPTDPAQSSAVSPTQTNSAGPSFDEVFSALDSDVQPMSSTLNNGAESPAHSAFPSSGSSRSVSSPVQRPSSPRVSSPTRNGRPSTTSTASSEKGHGQKEPERPAPRHSKLSIRFPFGKKKKQQEAAATQAPTSSASALLTPPTEEPLGMRTPKGDEDVEPVKQLTAMGFSRAQAVDALEKHSYDVARALNSLVGA